MRKLIFLLALALPLVANAKVSSTTVIAPVTNQTTVSTVSTALATTPKPKIKVCDVCSCTAQVIDCSSRGLNSSIFDYEYPPEPYRVFNFSYNDLERIKPLPSVRVEQLIFCHNKIQQIDDHAFKFAVNLTSLDLSHNGLSYENMSPHALRGRYSSESYEPLRKLRRLDLSYNNFTSLKPNIFEHVVDLRFLNLSHNPFSVYDTTLTLAINGLPYLEELDMSYCQLKKIDAGALHNHVNMKRLDLGYNRFSEPPHVLEEANSLETLILDGNPIEKLTADNGFPTMANLKELSMSNMSKLSSIGERSMCHLQALEVLRIENCKNLTDIDEFALAKKGAEGGAIWPPLKTINITNNALRYLSANLVARWDDVKELHLTGNKWHCDCDNQDLVGLILPNHGTRLMGNESSELRCAAPIEHLNHTLVSLASWKLRCPDMYGARPERDAAVLVGMLIGVILAVPLVLVFFVFWRKGFFFFGTQGPSTFSRAFYKRAPPYDADI